MLFLRDNEIERKEEKYIKTRVVLPCVEKRKDRKKEATRNLSMRFVF